MDTENNLQVRVTFKKIDSKSKLTMTFNFK